MQTRPTISLRSVFSGHSIRLFVAALPIGGLGFLLTTDAAGFAAPIGAVALVATVIGVIWRRSRDLASRRRAALEAYAEREIARAAEDSSLATSAVLEV